MLKLKVLIVAFSFSHLVFDVRVVVISFDSHIMAGNLCSLPIDGIKVCPCRFCASIPYFAW
jgi:hypothetical protein